MTRTYYWLGASLVLFSAFCFALKGIFIKLAFHYHIDAISLLTLRLGIALPIYLLFAVRLSVRDQSNNKKLTLRQWFWLGTLGITGYYIASFLNFEAFNYISAGLERILLLLILIKRFKVFLLLMLQKLTTF